MSEFIYCDYHSICYAVRDNDINTLSKIIAKDKTYINPPDHFDTTPLHLAKSVEVAKLLIDNGANINAKKEGGLTPLHVCKNSEICELLINNGADLNIKAYHIYTPLQYHIINFSDIRDCIAIFSYIYSPNPDKLKIIKLLIHSSDIDAKLEHTSMIEIFNRRVMDAKESFIHCKKEIKEINLIMLSINPEIANYTILETGPLREYLYINHLKEIYNITIQDFKDLAFERRKHALLARWRFWRMQYKF